MSWQLAAATALLLISATLLAVVGAIAWRYRPAPSARFTAIIIWLASAWSIGYAGELASVDLTLKTLFAKSQYLAIVAVPVVWLILFLQYTDRERWIKPWTAVLVAVEPIAALLLVWTTESHGLMWQAISLDTTGAFPTLAVTYGPWFWLNVTYSYVLFGLGIFILVYETQRASSLSRGQMRALLVSILAPIIGNILYVMRLSPFGDLDLTVYAFLITGPALLCGLLRSQFLDLVPIARDRVVESMTDGFLVLSPNYRVVDVNATTLHLLGKTQGETLGQPVAKLLGFQMPPGLDNANGHNGIRALGEFALGEGESTRTYEARVSPLQDHKDRLRGHVVLFTDVSEKKRNQLAFEDTIRRKDIAY